MSYTYLFFRPAVLPLTPANLDGDAVHPIEPEDAVREGLSRLFPELSWPAPNEGRAELEDRWLEFNLGGGAGTLSLRCSLRADHADVVQRICNELGWVAFDERPFCFQPHNEPFPA